MHGTPLGREQRAGLLLPVSRRGTIACLAVLASAATTYAQDANRTLTGMVVDPLGRGVGGVMVAVACEGAVARTVTADNGTFTVDTKGTSACDVIARGDGFEPLRLRVDPAAPVLLHLELARLESRVDVIAPPPERGPTFLQLRDDAVTAFGGDLDSLMNYAVRRAGATASGSSVLVDGLPATLLPPANSIESLTIDEDPFSPRYGGPPLARVEIVTRPPQRGWRLALNAAPLAAGGANPMGGGDRRTRGFQGYAYGPLPPARTSFSASIAVSRDRFAQPFRAVGRDGPINGTVEDRADTVRYSAGLHWGDATQRASVVVSALNASRGSAIPDALTTPDAAAALSIRQRDVRMTHEARTPRVLHRTAARGQITETSRAGDGGAPAIDVVGAFRGGASVDARATERIAVWNAAHVSQATSGRWLAGVSAEGGTFDGRTVSNPFGLFRFSSVGDMLAMSRAATWLRSPPTRRASGRTWSCAAFVQTDLYRTPARHVASGVRVDYQPDAGWTASPRITAQNRWRTWRVHGGAGTFTSAWTADLLAAGRRYAGANAQTIVLDPPLTIATYEDDRVQKSLVTSALDAALRRRRDLIIVAGLERHIGEISIAAAHTWTRGRSLYGWRRLPAPDGWLDRLESNRRRDRHELHIRAGSRWRAQSFTAHYSYVSSYDDTDGPSSFAARYDDLVAEHGRSSDVPAHHVTVVADLVPTRSVRLSILAEWRSRPPFDVITGLDPDRNGLFLDRNGAQRNRGAGPGYRSVDAYGYVPVPLDRIIKRSLTLDVALRAENLLGARNFTTLNGVLGSPLFGQPLGALPGRSVRVSISVRR
ncbi:MAG: hypothetical protein DMF86_05425 [Acidobacteria bacterium]|nr:MAG: hypothetical protein DMF86_05425 [Acidobacteriota bacterium]